MPLTVSTALGAGRRAAASQGASPAGGWTGSRGAVTVKEALSPAQEPHGARQQLWITLAPTPLVKATCCLLNGHKIIL